MTSAEATFSGVPAWLLAAYLIELGGAQKEDGGVRGEGWTARLVPDKTRVGGFQVGRVTVSIEGPAAGETLAALRRKAQRGGG